MKAKMWIIDPANVNFERFYFAVSGRGAKPVIEGALCSVRQKSPTKFRLAGLFNRVSPNTGFFTSAVHQTLSERTSRRLGRTDERNTVSASRGRNVIWQDTKDVGIKGLNSSVAGLRIRAAADTDLSDPTLKLQYRTAKRLQVNSRVQLNPY